MFRFQTYVWVIAGCVLLGSSPVSAGVANGDWKSGDCTDWDVDTSQNPNQEHGVAAFSFGLPEAANGPIQPCAAQGGEGNCAAFFGVGGPSATGQGASILLSQNGGPPPDGTGLLFLEAGVTHAFSAVIAAESRSVEPDPDGGTIIVRVHPAGAVGLIIAEHVFGPLQPQETRIAELAGTFVPAVSDFYILEIEFHRDFPHVQDVTPLNWIDNIALDPVEPPMGAPVPAASVWSPVGLALMVAVAGAVGVFRRRASAV